MEILVDGLDHVYLAVSDLARSEAFYDRFLSVLGFRKLRKPLAGGDVHAHYFNRVTQITLRPARGGPAHDPFAPGLHHLCLRVPDRASVDEAHVRVRALGLEPEEPRAYPEYAPDYYAFFLADPDGIRLEVTNHREERREIVRRWASYPRIAPVSSPPPPPGAARPGAEGPPPRGVPATSARPGAGAGRRVPTLALVTGGIVLGTGLVKIALAGLLAVFLVLAARFQETFAELGAEGDRLALFLPWIVRDIVWVAPAQLVIGAVVAVGGLLFMRLHPRARGLVEAATWIFLVFVVLWGGLWAWRLVATADPPEGFRTFALQNLAMQAAYVAGLAAFIAFLRSRKVRSLFASGAGARRDRRDG